MNLIFDTKIADGYKSNSQKIRVLSEHWVKQSIYCPSCGGVLTEHINNKPVADFYCADCSQDYELKSKSGSIGSKIVDGAYSTMISRIQSIDNPTFFLLTYNKQTQSIENFVAVPKHFFTANIIEKRKPLGPNAKRAGWVGCNILLKQVPQSGIVYYIKDGQTVPKRQVLKSWDKMNFLQSTTDMNARGWLLDILLCLEKIKNDTFELRDMYKFEKELSIKHPHNKHIKPKIRQQLQILRDKGIIIFNGRGSYTKIK